MSGRRCPANPAHQDYDEVVAAIDELDYRPHTAARILAGGRSKTLGLVTLDTTLYSIVPTLKEFQCMA